MPTKMPLVGAVEGPTTSRKTVFYDNFVSFGTSHFKHSCHIGPFSCHIGHFLSFWIVSQKTMFSTKLKMISSIGLHLV